MAPATLRALAVIVTDPAATPVTGTKMLLEPAAMLTVAGTVATAGAVEFRFTSTAVAAAADRFSVRF